MNRVILSTEKYLFYESFNEFVGISVLLNTMRINVSLILVVNTVRFYLRVVRNFFITEHSVFYP